MTRHDRYTQCRMTRGTSYTVGFIPSRSAVVGNIINLVINGRSQSGWLVESTGATYTKDTMRMLERQYTRQRKGSDV